MQENDVHVERLKKCYELAALSPDPSNQNAATIFMGDSLLCWGVNKFPPGLEVTEEMINDREKKYFYIEHAERGAVYQAARLGRKLHDTVMYCPWFACSDCARAIILSGVRKVIGHKQRMYMTPERWKKNVDDSLEMLRQCGVEIELLDIPELGAQSIIVNGKLWTP